MRKPAEPQRGMTKTITTTHAVTGPTQSAGRLLRRAEAARMLQVSVSTLRRMDDRLEPFVDDQGVHHYDQRRIEAARATLKQTVTTKVHDPHGIDGEIAASAFDIFEQGRGAVDAVRELRAHPDAIERLFKQWARMKGRVVLDGDDLDQIAHEAKVTLKLDPDLQTTAEEIVQWFMRLADGFHVPRVADASRPKPPLATDD